MILSVWESDIHEEIRNHTKAAVWLLQEKDWEDLAALRRY